MKKKEDDVQKFRENYLEQLVVVARQLAEHLSQSDTNVSLCMETMATLLAVDGSEKTVLPVLPAVCQRCISHMTSGAGIEESLNFLSKLCKHKEALKETVPEDTFVRMLEALMGEMSRQSGDMDPSMLDTAMLILVKLSSEAAQTALQRMLANLVNIYAL